MLQDDLDRLQNSDPEQRRKAIIALGRAKDPTALGPLADVYRNDPDPALRELAYKAGRYIKSSTSAPQPEPSGPTHSDFRVSTDEVLSVRPVSAAAVELARGYFDQAIDYQVRGDNGKAVELLAKAFETNPNLRNDSMARNLAMDITGVGSTSAIAMVTDPVEREALLERIVGPEAFARKRKHDDQSSWGSALIDLGIYGLVNGAIVFVASLLAAEVLLGFLTTAMAASPNAPASIEMLSRLNTQQVTLPLAALYGLITGVTAVIMLLIADSAIHVIATSVLGGAGTLAGLIRKTTLYYTAITALSLALNIGFAAVALNADQNSLSALSWVPLVISVLTAVWAGKLTGDAYDFGTAKGCAAMVLGYIALMLLSVCLVITLSMALAPVFQAVPR